MQEVSLADFNRFDLRVGKILAVERIPKTEKLYKLQVDIGQKTPIQLVSSLVPYYSAEELINRKIVVLVNLKAAKLAGELSQGMLLCAEDKNSGKCVLLTVHKDISAGTPIT